MAVRLDNTADRLTHDGTYPQTSAGWTYTAWVRIDVDRNEYSTWLRLSRQAGGYGTVATLGTGNDGTQGPNYFTQVGSVEPDVGMSVGVWIPVAGSRSGSTGDLITYGRPTGADPTISQSLDLTTGDITAVPDHICIGGRGSTDSSEWFNGSVAYVRIWSAELSQSEIEAEWASPVPVRTSDLHSNWELRDFRDLVDTVDSKTLTPQSGGVVTTTLGPLTGIANLCPNPSADVDLTGWSGPLGISTSENNQTADVIRATEIASLPKGTGFRYQSNGFARSAPAPVTAGNEYTISWWGYQTYGSLPFGTSYIVWYNSSGGDISYENLSSFNLVGDGMTGRRVGTATAPDGAVAMGLIQDGGVDCIISAVLVEEGAAGHDYADGDTAGWEWTGTTGLSTSRLAVDEPEPLSVVVTELIRTMGFTGSPGDNPTTTGSFTPAAGQRLLVTAATFEEPPIGPGFADEYIVSDSQGLTWTPLLSGFENDAPWAIGAQAWISSPAEGSSMTVTCQCPGINSWDQQIVILGLSNASGSISGLVMDTDAPVDGGYTVTLDQEPGPEDAVIFIRHLDNDGSEALSMGSGWTVYEQGYLGVAYLTGPTSDEVEVADTNVTPNGSYKSIDAAFIVKVTGSDPDPDPVALLNLGFFAAL